MSPQRPHPAMAFGLVVALAACEDKKPPPPAPPPAPKGPLSIADEPVAPRSILAIGTEGESAWRISVATRALDCETLRAAYPERPDKPKGSVLDFWLMQPLEADGTRGACAFRSAFLSDAAGARGLLARGGLCDALQQSGETIRVRGLELALGDAKTNQEILWSGDLEAKSCGRVPRPEPDRHQPALELEVANQRFAIHGATLRPDNGKHLLRLTRAPHDCNSIFTEGYDLYLTLLLGGEPAKPVLELASLQGDLFPGFPAGSEGKESFVLDLEDEEGPTEATIDASLELQQFRVRIKGRLEIQRCKLAG